MYVKKSEMQLIHMLYLTNVNVADSDLRSLMQGSSQDFEPENVPTGIRTSLLKIH